MLESIPFTIDYTLLALLSAFLAAIANIMARTILKNVKSRDILGINFLMMAAVLTLFSPMFYFFEFSLWSVVFLLMVAAIDLVANYFYFKSFEENEATAVTPLLSLSPVFAFVFGWFFISEVVSLYQLVIMIAIVVCIIIFSYDFSKGFKFQSIGLNSAVMASILFGLSAIPAKILLTNLGAINAPTLYSLRASLIGLFGILFLTSKVKEISLGEYKLVFLRGIVVIAQLREKPTIKKAIAAILVLTLSFML